MKYIMIPPLKYMVSLPLRLIFILLIYVIRILYNFDIKDVNSWLNFQFTEFCCKNTKPGHRLIYIDFKTWMIDPFIL